MLELHRLSENIVQVNHKYSSKKGKWGWWVTDTMILEFLGDENYEVTQDIDLIISNHKHYWKKVDILRKRHNLFKKKR